MKKMDITGNLKKYLLPNFPYILVFWFANKLGMAYRLAEGADMMGKLMGSMSTLGRAMANPLPSFMPFDLLVGAAGAAIIYAVVRSKKKNAKKYRKDVEYGSARWGTEKDIKG